MLDDLRDTVEAANDELERFDRLVTTAESVTGTVDSASRLAYIAMANPVIKGVAFASGTAKAARRLRGAQGRRTTEEARRRWPHPPRSSGSAPGRRPGFGGAMWIRRQVLAHGRAGTCPSGCRPTSATSVRRLGRAVRDAVAEGRAPWREREAELRAELRPRRPACRRRAGRAEPVEPATEQRVRSRARLTT